MYTLQQLRNIILQKADEDPNDVEQYIINIINKAINDAYIDIVRSKHLLLQKDMVVLGDNYSFSTSQLSKIVNKIFKITDETGMFDIPFAQYDQDTFVVSPFSDTVVVHYSYIPMPLIYDTDMLAVDYIDTAIIYKGLAEYFLLNRKPDLAMVYIQLYNQEKNKIKTDKGGIKKFKIRWDLI